MFRPHGGDRASGTTPPATARAAVPEAGALARVRNTPGFRMSKLESTDKLSQSYLTSIFAADILTLDEEQTFFRRWKDKQDKAALDRVVVAHARLAVSLAGEFRRYGLPNSDLVQAGNEGLMEAAHRFDPDRGVRFATYAMWWIRAACQSYVLNNWSSVRFVTTNDRKRVFFRLAAIRNRLGVSSASRLSPEAVTAIAAEIGVSEADVLMMDQRLSAKDSSLNETVRIDNTLEFQDMLVDERPTPEQAVTKSMDDQRLKAIVAAGLDQLSTRERAIIEARRMAETPETLEDLSQRFAVSRERIRQIERRALERMRTFITAHFAAEDLIEA
jgi:RNA polymerase sigma-32 factor